MTNANNISLHKKKKIITNKIDLLPKKEIDRIYDKYISSSENSEEKEIKINKNTKKYKLGLQIVNKFLENIGKEPIDDLLEFKDVERKKLLTKENYQYILDHSKEIFEVFDKKKFNYYYRNNHKNYMYVITFLKALCKELGLKFTYRQTTFTNDKKMTQCKTLYLIKII